MPLFRFMIHGRDTQAPDGQRGFYTTRHAFGATEEEAARKVLNRVREEFATGSSGSIWRSGTPAMSIESAARIGMHQIWAAPNKGSTFYDETKG